MSRRPPRATRTDTRFHYPTLVRSDWMVGFFYSDEDLDRTETYRISPHYEPYLSIALLSLVNPALGQLPNAPTFLADATGRTPGTVFAGLGARSEEHTSELQSLMRTSSAVFCLKKKKITNASE